jgi:uncharacterized membrane protein YgdD (TMEM256/DUF423 family)
MNSSLAVRIAAIAGFLAVAFGAVGAHALKPYLESHGKPDAWHTAALYHIVHAIVLLVLAQRTTIARLPFALFGAGIVLFSGSLYALALTNIRFFAFITPFGGICLIAGWLALAICPKSANS